MFFTRTQFRGKMRFSSLPVSRDEMDHDDDEEKMTIVKSEGRPSSATQCHAGLAFGLAGSSSY